MPLRRVILAGIFACALSAAFIFTHPEAARAEDYPARPITLIVPYPPGGGVDVMGRLVGQKLSAAFGQQVVIENRAGAGGMIGTRDAAKVGPRRLHHRNAAHRHQPRRQHRLRRQ